MAQNLSTTKSNYISNVAAQSQIFIASLQAMIRLSQDGQDLGFESGGANAIVDTDINGSNAYMTAVILNAGLTTVAAVNTALSNNSRAGWVNLLALVPNPA